MSTHRGGDAVLCEFPTLEGDPGCEEAAVRADAESEVVLLAGFTGEDEHDSREQEVNFVCYCSSLFFCR
jgi:hypothetical protein